MINTKFSSHCPGFSFVIVKIGCCLTMSCSITVGVVGKVHSRSFRDAVAFLREFSVARLETEDIAALFLEWCCDKLRGIGCFDIHLPHSTTRCTVSPTLTSSGSNSSPSLLLLTTSEPSF